MTFNIAGISWRTLEKILAYAAALIGATNGFSQMGIPANLRETLMGVGAVIVTALHLSGPAATSNTSTSPGNTVVVKK